MRQVPYVSMRSVSPTSLATANRAHTGFATNAIPPAPRPLASGGSTQAGEFAAKQEGECHGAAGRYPDGAALLVGGVLAGVLRRGLPQAQERLGIVTLVRVPLQRRWRILGRCERSGRHAHPPTTDGRQVTIAASRCAANSRTSRRRAGRRLSVMRGKAEPDAP